MNPRATAGRIVHYGIVNEARAVLEMRAAIVNTDTRSDGTAELTVFLDTFPIVVQEVSYAEQPTLKHWSWMPYQKAKALLNKELPPELVDLDTFTDLFLRVEKLEKHNEDRAVSCDEGEQAEPIA